MATIARGLAGHGAEPAHRAVKAKRLAAILGTLVAASVAVNALIILADSRLRDRAPVAGDCSLVADGGSRPACDGDLAPRSGPLASTAKTPGRSL